MAFIVRCDFCNKEEEARRPGIYYLAPVGWYQTLDGKQQACSTTCVQQLETETPFKPIKPPMKTVGQEACRWCARLKALCPAHSKQVARSQQAACSQQVEKKQELS